MKREVMGKFLFVIIISIFLCSGIFAVDEGTCGIVTSAECNEPGTEGYPIMGLSSSTNAHGEFPLASYLYVLCCNFGDGDTTCTADNKIIGLSSSTNAHAESPLILPPNYLTDVCYEDMECIGSTNDCGAVGTDAEYYPLAILSLSGDTNAHIGNSSDYFTRICCNSVLAGQATCELESASWNIVNAVEGQRIYLQVTGSGPECGGVTVSFEIREADVGGSNPVTTNPQNVAFSGSTATGVWYAEWQEDGPLGNPEYYFNVSISDDPSISITSSNELTVTQRDEDACIDIITCDDYDDEQDCISDAGICNVAGDSGEGIIDCSSEDIVCGCVWNSATGCSFGYSEIEGGENCDPVTDPSCCEPGETLCSDDVCRDDCDTIGTNCDNDGTCDSNEGCSCIDCDREQDSCDYGAICSEFFGACTCNYGFTLCIDDSGTAYCNLGDSCPGTDAPTDLPENQNGSCDFGFDGCLSPDCEDGDQDTCLLGTYCISGRCFSLEGPNVSFGNCKISQDVEKGCDEEPVGYKVVTWVGEWTGEQSGEAYEKCIAGGRRSIPCPAQIQLPFFEYTELIITTVVIAGIYILLILKSKFKKKAKRRKR